MTTVVSSEIREARIACLVKTGAASTWNDLCFAFGLDPDSMSASHEALRAALRSLKRAGVLDYSDPPEGGWSYPGMAGSIRETQSWYEIQSLLGIDLKRIVDCDPRHAMTVTPLWGGAVEDLPRPDLFVLAPTGHRNESVYKDHIAKVASRLSLAVGRADDPDFPRYKRASVWSGILQARVIVADCTGRDASVFYEIGLADAIGKNIILIAQTTGDLPLGREYVSSICYSPDGWPEFEQELAERVWGLLAC